MWETNGNLRWAVGGYQGFAVCLVCVSALVCDHVYLGVYVPDAEIQTRSAHGVFSFKSWCVRV